MRLLLITNTQIPSLALAIPPQLMPGYMATQVDIISSNNIALEVVEQLKLDQNKEVLEKFEDTPEPGKPALGKAELKNQIADYLLKGFGCYAVKNQQYY